MSIEYTVVIRSKKGCASSLKKHLLKLIEPTRREEACMKYVLNQDVNDENTFIVHEEWRDEEGFELHNQQTYITQFIDHCSTFFDGDTIMYKTAPLHDEQVSN